MQSKYRTDAFFPKMLITWLSVASRYSLGQLSNEFVFSKFRMQINSSFKPDPLEIISETGVVGMHTFAKGCL